MRIIAGQHKGRRLKSLQGQGERLRPTSDRVREALFSILSPRLPGSNFLDLYAGTGAVGIEALSRGAKQVMFVESHKDSLHILKENVHLCGVQHQSVIMAQTTEAWLHSWDGKHMTDTFNIIFADPPYHFSLGDTLFSHASIKHMLDPEGLFVIEHASHTIISPMTSPDFIPQHSYRYGDTTLTTLAHRDPRKL